MGRFDSVRSQWTKVANAAGWVGPLLARLSLGVLFAQTGWGKLHSLPDVTAFFEGLGIPAPGFNAHLVAITELAGGIALVVGLATRLAAVPLAIVMVVATLTAKLGDVTGVVSFLALEEVVYFAVLVWLMVAGPGAVSVDARIARQLDARADASRGHDAPRRVHEREARAS